MDNWRRGSGSGPGPGAGTGGGGGSGRYAMDRNISRPHWYNRQGGGGLKGGRPPRLTLPEPQHPHHPSHSHSHNAHSPGPAAPPPPTTPPAQNSAHDDLINYIFESWDKLSREARYWEPPRQSPPQRPPLPPIDLDSWCGRRHMHNPHTHTIKHNS